MGTAVARGLLQAGRGDAEGLDQRRVDGDDDAVAGHAHQAEDPAVDATEGLRALLSARTGQHRHLLRGGGDRQEDGHAHRCDGGAAVPHEDAAVLGQGDVLGHQSDGDATRPPLVGAGQRQLAGGMVMENWETPPGWRS